MKKRFLVEACFEAYGVPVIDDAQRVFAKSANSHLYVAIATGGTATATEMKLRKSELYEIVNDHRIPVVHMEHRDIQKGKPAPDMFAVALQEMRSRYDAPHLKPQEVIGFDDTEPGVQSAYRAGLVSVAIPTKWSASQDFSPWTKYKYSSMTVAIQELSKVFSLPKEVYS